MLRTAVVVAITSLYAAFVAAPVLLWCLITNDDDMMFKWGVRGARVFLKLAGVRIRIDGREHIQWNGTCVYMSNHVGNIEPPALVASLPRVAALVKREVMEWPILGRALALTGYVAVDRGTSRAPEAVQEAVEVLRGGRSFLVFPEGTRSRTGRMLPFRRGAFLMTIRAGVPIVPITVLGSREIMRKDDLRIRPGEIRLIVHPPVSTAGLSDNDRFELAERVRDIIASALPPEQRPEPQPAEPSPR